MRVMFIDGVCLSASDGERGWGVGAVHQVSALRISSRSPGGNFSMGKSGKVRSHVKTLDVTASKCRGTIRSSVTSPHDDSSRQTIEL